MAKNILICDDAAFMRMMIKDILTKNGYNVVGEAENGAKAVEKYQELKPDLVLMDIMMPVLNGYEAARRIRSLDREDAKKIPIIAMTANAFTEDRIRAKEAGMDEHVAKPVDVELLIKVIRKLVND